VERDRGRAGGEGVLVQRAGDVVYNSEPVEQPPRPVVLSYVKQGAEGIGCATAGGECVKSLRVIPRS
jgi:hypothetical protein